MNYNQWFKKEIVGDQSQKKVDYSRKPADRVKVSNNIVRDVAMTSNNWVSKGGLAGAKRHDSKHDTGLSINQCIRSN